MVEFLEQHGAEIVSIIIALAGMATAIFNFKKTIALNKQTKQEREETRQDIQITRQGIVDAFKSAKIPTEWKVDVSNKINTTLEGWRDDLIGEVHKSQAVANELLLMAVKILSFTAASNKLSDEEKARLDELKRLISNEDKTIDISE